MKNNVHPLQEISLTAEEIPFTVTELRYKYYYCPVKTFLKE